MAEQTYPAARVVAEQIQSRLNGHMKVDTAAIENLVSAAFWASLRHEEGRAPTISLAYVAPEQVRHPLLFATPLPLDPYALVRLAPAVERPGIHLGVWDLNSQLRIWGTTRTLPTWCFVLEVIAPGLLVVKFRRAESATKFANVAVLDGANVKFIAQRDVASWQLPSILNSLMAFYSSGGREQADNVLLRLAISMRGHARGGTLLVVPSGSEEWTGSIVKPISYSITSPVSEIDGLSMDSTRLQAAIDSLAGWTAVDGATVISNRFALLASGVKIVSRDASRRVAEILVTEPIEGFQPAIVEPAQLGNTRHLSAAQFVYDQRDAVALVASQDGRFTVFGWSAAQNIVHGHRLESLLL